MAAPGGCGEVRVRLTFEYPPPALPQSRHMWFMLDTEQCRAVTDVSAIIRERFFYSRRGALALYLDGCLLPPGESVRLIRDNDAISVKWEEPEDGSADCRRRPEDGSADCRRRPEDGSADCRKRKGVSVSVEDESDIPRKSKKRAVHESAEDESDDRRKSKKKGVSGSVEDESDIPRKSKKRAVHESAEDESDIPRKSIKKGGPGSAEDGSDDRRKSRKKGGPGSAEDGSDDRRKSRKKGGPGSVEDGSDDRRKSRKKGGPGSAEDESDDHRKSRKKGGPGSAEDGGDDRRKSRKKGGPGSAEDESGVPEKTKKRAEVTPEEVSAEASEKKPSYQEEPGGPVHKEAPPPLSSSRAAAMSSSSSSSSDQEDTGRGKGEEPGPPLRTQQRDGSIVKKPLISGLVSFPSVCNGRGARGGAQRRPPLKTAGRGLPRGRGIDNLPWGGRGFRGRGETQPQKHFFYNCSPEKAKEEPLSNVSVLIQNPPEVQKTDYGTLPLLAAPPQPGKIIAFKLLELTENYTPEVSDYKEGRVLSYDAVSQQLEVEILSQQRRKEPGKFDLVYEGADGRNIVEYAVPQECKITQAWSSLIEPRLVTEHASPAAGP